jgi:diaminohydroxyphosphoribosylaminopyrimidine deaminase / 5-amino-6-(5-phosphoribosylamino)uracil reductase
MRNGRKRCQRYAASDLVTEIWTPEDVVFMRRALDLAATQLGRTGANPAVGCVLVRDGVKISEGVTADGGRPHGEAMALAKLEAGDARGATAYVTLEPCAHESPRGPHCSGALIDAGIVRLVCCLMDPDPRTAGRGFARLAKAGIRVDVGLFSEEGATQISDFSTSF